MSVVYFFGIENGTVYQYQLYKEKNCWVNPCGIRKSHPQWWIFWSGTRQASSVTKNIPPWVRFPYPTWILMMVSINHWCLCICCLIWRPTKLSRLLPQARSQQSYWNMYLTQWQTSSESFLSLRLVTWPQGYQGQAVRGQLWVALSSTQVIHLLVILHHHSPTMKIKHKSNLHKESN